MLASACSGRVNSSGRSPANAGGGSAGNFYGSSGDGGEQPAPIPDAGNENTAGRSPVVGAGSGNDAGSAGSHVGGASGRGGESATSGPGDAGAGGVANDACDTGNGCILEYGSEITALTADDSTLYWVEHGTSDNLGNYNNDG
ncbi:MAG TPA: hypothetical protein VF294_18555, partial [Polyangiaceae bacterium]